MFPHGAYTDIKNILAIQNDPVYEVALREWDRREAYLGNGWKGVFNVVGFFSVFQGVVLTAVSQLKSDTSCGIIWFPVILSIIACVVSIVGLRIKFRNLRKELEDSIRDEKSAQKVSPCNLSIRAYNLSSDQLLRLRGISHHRAAGRCKGRWSSGLPPFKKYSTYTCKCETHTAGRRTKGGPCEVSQAMEAHRSSLILKLSVKEPRCGTFQPKTSGRVLLPLAVAAWTHQLLFHPCPSFLPL